MTELTTGKQYTDVVYFCPECGSPSINEQNIGILGGDPLRTRCSCAACGWAGTKGDLIATPLIHEFADKQEIVRALMGDLRILLARNFVETFGRFLVKWGFLDKPISARQLGRYTVAVANGVIQAVLEERQKMAKEKVDDERPE